MRTFINEVFLFFWEARGRGAGIERIPHENERLLEEVGWKKHKPVLAIEWAAAVVKFY